jgi:imidazolonepropionase-like amidohydrolase
LPGLIDTHVHLTLGGRPRDNATATARAGFTTVADLGSSNYSAIRLKRLIEADSVVGPRMITAGSWIGGRGGVCEFGGATIRGAEEATARVTADLNAGARLIKLCITNWLPVALQHPDSAELTDAEMSAIATRAGAAGLRTVAHAIGQRGALAATEHGVRWLAHTPVVDSAAAARLARNQVCVSSTLTSLAQGPDGTALRDSFQRLLRAGVRITTGTDAGVVPHGSNANEVVTLTEAGVNPLDALRAGTIWAAECIGLGSDYVSLKVGAPADLIAVRSDPLANIRVLMEPAVVVLRGRLILQR